MATAVHTDPQAVPTPGNGSGVRPFRLSREAALRLVQAGLIPEGPGVQLIEGELVEYEVQGTSHATSVGLAQDALLACFGAGYVVRIQLPLALSDYSQPEPDVAVARGSRRDFLAEHPTASQTVLVLEVADATLRYDQQEKASMYARAGVHDLWIVNLVERKVEVYRDPMPSDDAPFGWHYRVRQMIPAGGKIAPLAEHEQCIRAADLLP